MKLNFIAVVKNYKIHLLIWLIFILYETVIIGLVYGAFGKPITYIAHYTLIIVLFYLHALLSLPWSLETNKTSFWRVPLILIAELGLFIVVSFLIDSVLTSFGTLSGRAPLTLDFQYAMKSVYRIVYFIGFATGYCFILRYNNEKKRTNELEKQHLKDIIYRQKSQQELTKAQNSFLKAQINPHFLFNSLDFIYHNIDSLSPVAADAVIILSEMMRYAIDSDKMGDYISLGDEIDQVNNLLYLNQMRKSHELCFTLNLTEEVRIIQLIPLVLLTLVENIFKHGNLSQPEHGAEVKLYLSDEHFIIETDNLVNHASKPGSQTGLANINERLKYAYGNEVRFTYHVDDRNHFVVFLAIPVEPLYKRVVLPVSLKDNDTGLAHAFADLN
jgi:two-component system LytT family sensor kinase